MIQFTTITTINAAKYDELKCGHLVYQTLTPAPPPKKTLSYKTKLTFVFASAGDGIVCNIELSDSEFRGSDCPVFMFFILL